MTRMTIPAEGGCRCGRVRFRVTKPPMLTMACHCRRCQRMTASAFSLTVAIPTDGFAVIAGEPEAGGCHAPGQNHQHCGWCKSWLFTRVPADYGFVNVRATMLDDASWFVPFAETYTSEALPWATTPAVHSFDRFPEPSDYGPILEAFARTQD